MKDRIVQEVRDARAAVAADFDFDLHKFFAWAKAHSAAERKSKHWLPTSPGNQALATTGEAALSTAGRKRRARSADVST